MLRLAAALLVVAHLLLAAPVEAIFHQERMSAEIGTVITKDETVVIDLVARMKGMDLSSNFIACYAHRLIRDRDMKDEGQNGINGEDRKGEFDLPSRTKN